MYRYYDRNYYNKAFLLNGYDIILYQTEDMHLHKNRTITNTLQNFNFSKNVHPCNYKCYVL